jgi:hypothetical protein
MTFGTEILHSNPAAAAAKFYGMKIGNVHDHYLNLKISHLGCDAMLFREQFQNFQRTVVPSSSESWTA